MAPRGLATSCRTMTTASNPKDSCCRSFRRTVGTSKLALLSCSSREKVGQVFGCLCTSSQLQHKVAFQLQVPLLRGSSNTTAIGRAARDRICRETNGDQRGWSKAVDVFSVVQLARPPTKYSRLGSFSSAHADRSRSPEANNAVDYTALDDGASIVSVSNGFLQRQMLSSLSG